MKNANLNSEKKFKNLALILTTIMMFNLAQANSTTTYLSLSGFIDEYVSLSIRSKNDFADFDLNSNQIEIPIATILESSNSNSGYIVKARSLNNSKIVDQATHAEIPYNLKYGNGQNFTLGQNDQTIKEQTHGDVQIKSERELKITFHDSSAKQLVTGLYKDIITFTVEGR